ncbi:MAG: rhomboid family intramembrane serine protease [Tannerella sp.]|jgi:membrane associated rhomboid family serine protease|nr:rhomboid family intramembrane serine protease [Tannerella sp.]
MKYLFVLLFIIVFCLFDKNLGYTNASPWWTHFTYLFQHAGIVHLLINSLSFIGMFRLLEKFINRWVLSVSVITVGFVASFLSMYNAPTVGASAMVYAMVGIFFSMVNLCGDIKILDKKKFAVFIVGIAACLFISASKGNSNFFLHVFSLILGLIAGTVIAIFREEM